MEAPPLADIATSASRLTPSPESVAALVTGLERHLGADRISTVEAARRAASTDYAHLSPLLTAVLPRHPADIVVRPRDTDQLSTAVRLAYQHHVPVVPRGRGTGNYGQAVPLAGGLVIDMTGADQIIEVGDGFVRAQAGTTFVALEAAAHRRGQEVMLVPTTVGSTVGGFLAGGAGGIGSIEHGWLWDEFVAHLRVVVGSPPGAVLSARDTECLPYLHAYGVTGIIAEAAVRLVPARDRVAMLTSFPSEARGQAVEAALALLKLDPAPRLVSLDEPAIVAHYPADDAMPAGRHSLRAVVDAAMVGSARQIVTAAGGQVETVCPEATGYLSTLAFNHVTLRARRSDPRLCHLQVSGEALITRTDEVLATLPAAMLHLDGLRTFADPNDPARGRGLTGLLLSQFVDAPTLYAGVTRLRQLGVNVVDPHSWLLGGPALGAIQQTAAINDPAGLFNPGKLP